jgi:hypothetical protein
MMAIPIPCGEKWESVGNEIAPAVVTMAENELAALWDPTTRWDLYRVIPYGDLFLIQNKDNNEVQ